MCLLRAGEAHALERGCVICLAATGSASWRIAGMHGKRDAAQEAGGPARAAHAMMLLIAYS